MRHKTKWFNYGGDKEKMWVQMTSRVRCTKKYAWHNNKVVHSYSLIIHLKHLQGWHYDVALFESLHTLVACVSFNFWMKPLGGARAKNYSNLHRSEHYPPFLIERRNQDFLLDWWSVSFIFFSMVVISISFQITLLCPVGWSAVQQWGYTRTI